MGNNQKRILDLLAEKKISVDEAQRLLALLEPEEGVFRFAWMDRVIATLHNGGIGVILATPTASPPPWFTRLHPDAMPVRQDGVRLSHGSRDTYSICAPGYRAASRRITTALAERYGDHPALIAWHVHNEYGTYDWGEHAAQAFRRWLQRKYGSLEALRRRPVVLGLVGLLVLAVAAVVGIGLGTVHISAADTIAILAHRFGWGVDQTWAQSSETIVVTLRLPRVLTALTVGLGLSVAGVTFQGLLRNPLADPYLIGVSSGAGLGATVAIALGLPVSWGGLGAVSLLAFFGALASTTLVFFLSRVGGRSSTVTLVLAGVAVGAFLSAVTTFVMFRVQDAFRTVHALGWMMGSFALSSWAKVHLMTPVLVLGGGLL